MSLKTLLHHLWEAIDKVFKNASKEVREVALPVAVKAVESLKTLIDLDQSDMVGKIAGPRGVVFEDKVRQLLPKILLELKLVEKCASKETTEEIIACAVSELRLSSDRAKDAFFHSISALLLKDLSDGKLSWSECVELVEFYYKSQHKPAEDKQETEQQPEQPKELSEP
ncbi:MAG: hypothetical protein INR73_14365 [Williamsia sp.]|nr:hypothetical protein [Williamsia sp.]